MSVEVFCNVGLRAIILPRIISGCLTCLRTTSPDDDSKWIFPVPRRRSSSDFYHPHIDEGFNRKTSFGQDNALVRETVSNGSIS